MSNQRITLTVKGEDLNFDVNEIAYTGYVNGTTQSDKIAPAKQFLKRTIAAEDKEKLEAILKLPGACLQLTAKIMEEYMPDLEIEVKK